MNFTPEQHLANLKLALKCWARVSPNLVVRDLTAYESGTSCGTAACFGGWLPHFPEFQALGVIRSVYGAPLYYAEPQGGTPELRFLEPEVLFGEKGTWLFCTRLREEQMLPLTDHELVSHRLRVAIDATEAALNLPRTYSPEELE